MNAAKFIGVAIMVSLTGACEGSGNVAQTSIQAERADERPFETPLPVNTQPKILSVDGYSHTVGVKADGTVWVWGSADHGEMGLGKEVDGSVQPKQIPGLTDVVEVAGGRHLLALRKDGTVWSWGQNKFGQLGYETDKPWSAVPKQILGLVGIISVAAGWDHSLALSRDGTVFSFGKNTVMALGQQPADKFPHTHPQVAYKYSGALKVISGVSTSALLGPDGNVIIWGTDLERHDTRAINDGSVPHPLTFVPPGQIADIAIGSAIIVLSKDGYVWASGLNNTGSLGQGNFEKQSGWKRVKNLGRVTSIATKGGSVVALDEAGRIWQWGDSVRWQPRLSERKLNMEALPVRIPGTYPGGFIVAGMRAAVLLPNGNSFFWGWDLGARGRPIDKKSRPGDEAWFVPELSSWTWK